MSENLAHLLDRLGRSVHNLQYSGGLNPAQWEALRFLSRANPYTRKPSSLAEYLGTTKGTVSQTLKCLEEKGLIKRVAEPRDRRAVRLELTPAGSSMLDEDPLRRLEDAASDIRGDVEMAVLLLSKYVRQLQGRCGMKPFGVCETCGHFSVDPCVDRDRFRCGLTGEPLAVPDIKKICGSHQSVDA